MRIKIPNIEDTPLGRDIYISRRMESIREKMSRVAALDAMETRERVDITHAMVGDEEMVLVCREGEEEGVAVAVADIEAGRVSLQDAVNVLMDN